MDQFLNSLPKTVIAIAALVIGLLLMRALQPPATVCDAQLEIFRDSQKKFLYPDPAVNNIQKISPVKAQVETCRADNSPGGCFELFEGLKKMNFDLSNISEQCASSLQDDGQVKSWLPDAMKLMALTAWGSRPPTSYITRNGWFDSSEISLFCGLRRQYERIFGKEKFENFREDILSNLPQSDRLAREQKWPLTIFANSCDSYR